MLNKVIFQEKIFIIIQIWLENLFYCTSIPINLFATNICTCHDSAAVLSYAKNCSNQFIKIWIRIKQNLHWMWIRVAITGPVP